MNTEKTTKKDCFEIARSEVEREANLINQRITWLLAFSSILFAAFAVLVSADSNNLIIEVDTLKLLPSVFATVGLFQCIAIFFGISGAYIKMRFVRKEMLTMKSDESHCHSLIFNSTAVIFGMIASIGTIFVLSSAWAVILFKLCH